MSLTERLIKVIWKQSSNLSNQTRSYVKSKTMSSLTGAEADTNSDTSAQETTSRETGKKERQQGSKLQEEKMQTNFKLLQPCLYEPNTSHVISQWASTTTPQPTSLASYIFENVQDHATLPALVSGDSSLTYLEACSSSLKFGNSLLDQGVKPGQVLAVVLPNKIELPIVTIGASEVGVAVAPICPSSPTESIRRQLVSSCASAVITTSDLLPKVHKAARYYGKPLSVIVVDDGNDRDEFKLDIEKVSRDVITWPTQEQLSSLHFSPAVLAWCDRAGHAAFSHKNVIAGLKQMGKTWDSVSGDVVEQNNKQITALVTIPAFRPSGLAAIMFHLRLGHRVVIDGKCLTLPAGIDQYRPSVYHWIMRQGAEPQGEEPCCFMTIIKREHQDEDRL